jgi:regulator of RNase E activity RraA
MAADEIVANLLRLSCTNLSDAMDALGLAGALAGLRPLLAGRDRLVGRAVTIRLAPAGDTIATRHIGVTAIELAVPGDVLVVDNQGRTDSSCFGGVLATAARQKGIVGVVADGVCRDLNDYEELGFAVFARGATIATARGRSAELATNEPVQCCGVTIGPGDYIVADRDGVLAIPRDGVERVVQIAQAIAVRETAMMEELKRGASLAFVDRKYRYNAMLHDAKEL